MNRRPGEDPIETFRVALTLPLNVMIVNEQTFTDRDSADALRIDVYAEFPGFEVITQEIITSWPGTVYEVKTPQRAVSTISLAVLSRSFVINNS